jgi:hypothetical protein
LVFHQSPRRRISSFVRLESLQIFRTLPRRASFFLLSDPSRLVEYRHDRGAGARAGTGSGSALGSDAGSDQGGSVQGRFAGGSATRGLMVRFSSIACLDRRSIMSTSLTVFGIIHSGCFSRIICSVLGGPTVPDHILLMLRVHFGDFAAVAIFDLVRVSLLVVVQIAYSSFVHWKEGVLAYGSANLSIRLSTDVASA